MRARLRTAALPIAVAVASLTAATIAVAILQEVVGVPNPSAVYLVAVVATALVSGTAGAIATAAASFFLYNFFFTEPRYTLTMNDPAAWLSAVLLLFVAIVVGQLVALQRNRAATSAAREREARALFRVSRALATRDSTDAVLAEIASGLAAEARMSRVWIGLGSNAASERIVATSDPAPSTSDVARSPGLVNHLRRMPGDEPAQWVRIHRPSTPSSHSEIQVRSRSDDDTYQVPITTGSDTVGSIWASRAHSAGLPSPSQTRLLAAAADQLGQVLVHDRLIAESRSAEVARESDALKSALLQSVSHDLRTPLATIRAAAGTLRGSSGDPQAELESALAIEREVDYLNRLVTNLLDLSRIEAGVLKAETDVFELDDLLADSLARLAPSMDGREVEIRLPASPVRVDPVFLDAAVSNVIDNAVRHSDPTSSIRIGASEPTADTIRLTIEDGGHGVPDAELANLFDKFYRVPSSRPDSRHGTGIGLAVVKGLVEAMGGSVSARRSELGGLAIDIDLPAAAVPANLVATAP